MTKSAIAEPSKRSDSSSTGARKTSPTTIGISDSEHVWAWRCSVMCTTQISATKKIASISTSGGRPDVVTASNEPARMFSPAPNAASAAINTQMESAGTCVRVRVRNDLLIGSARDCAGPGHARPRHARPTHPGPRHARPADPRPTHPGPRHARPRHARPAHTGPRHAGPAHAGPRHAGPAHAVPRPARPRHAGPAHAGPRHAVP